MALHVGMMQDEGRYSKIYYSPLKKDVIQKLNIVKRKYHMKKMPKSAINVWEPKKGKKGERTYWTFGEYLGKRPKKRYRNLGGRLGE
jgi:hypothetical protein